MFLDEETAPWLELELAQIHVFHHGRITMGV